MLSLNWLRSPLVLGGQTVRPALDPASVDDHDLPDICLRMQLVMSTIEHPRCEGRLLPQDLFDLIDTLYSDLKHQPANRLEDWKETIAHFGEYYDLIGEKPIELTHPGAEEDLETASRYWKLHSK